MPMSLNSRKSLYRQLAKQYGGKWRSQKLAALTWFRVGGLAECFVVVPDETALTSLLAQLPSDIPLFVLGAGSNVLVRDGGMAGVVLRLGRGFGKISALPKYQWRVGAAVPDVVFARATQKSAVAGLEFYSGIPGTIGGALAMNAGAFGNETAQCLVQATAFTRDGKKHVLGPQELGYAYRHCARAGELIFTEAILQGKKGSRAMIAKRMAEIQTQRSASQPVRQRTGGSTFRNPHGPNTAPKAWELIAHAGGRGMKLGQAQMSDVHCNFMVNLGTATASELELLGTLVQSRVLLDSDIALEWEIHRVGQGIVNAV